MGRSGNREDIIETHREIRYDNSPNSRHKPSFFRIDMMFFMSRHPQFSVEFPYNIEKKESSGELYSHKREEKYRKKCKNDTKNGRKSNPKENGFFPFRTLKLPSRHPDKDCIIPAHHDVDEDDIQKYECSMRCKEI